MLFRSFGTLTLVLQSSRRLLRNNCFFGIILARTAPTDDIHRCQLGSVELRDVSHMDHVWKPKPCHQNGKLFDLTGPDRTDTVPNGGQRKSANTIKKAAHGHFGSVTSFRRDRAACTVKRPYKRYGPLICQIIIAIACICFQYRIYYKQGA